MKILFRPFAPTVEPVVVPWYCRYLRHPIFAWAGLRPFFAQHTVAEHEALRNAAKGRKVIVEIGVAEGVSALALREAMDERGRLYLIDPFHLGRVPGVRALRRAAGAAVNSVRRGEVQWVEKFSFEAAKEWNTPIDLLFIDGDHSYEAVARDWEDWHRFVVPGGVVLLHDARVFPSGWTHPEDGPVRFVYEAFRSKPNPEWRICLEVHSLVGVERQA